VCAQELADGSAGEGDEGDAASVQSADSESVKQLIRGVGEEQGRVCTGGQEDDEAEHGCCFLFICARARWASAAKRGVKMAWRAVMPTKRST